MRIQVGDLVKVKVNPNRYQYGVVSDFVPMGAAVWVNILFLTGEEQMYPASQVEVVDEER